MAELAVNGALVLIEVLDHVFSFLNKERNLMENMIANAEYFKDFLRITRGYLKDMENKEGSEELNEKVKVYRDIAYDIEDVLDEFMLHVPYDPLHRHKLIKRVREVGHNLRHRHPLRTIYSKIQRIRERIDDNNRHPHFPGSGGGSATFWEAGSSSGSRTEHQLIPYDDIVGFEELKEQLMTQLIDGEGRCETISLLGQGGSGKTLLVNNIYESKRVRGQFDCHAWVHVSRSFNDEKPEELLYSMLKRFCASRREEQVLDESVITQAKLREYLQQKRYLVVLDDVWSIGQLECIKKALPSGSCRSRIIVTTQKLDVASTDSNYIHKLDGLPQPKAWDLFCRNAFKTRNGECPPELEECSWKIVKRCEQLPLAIVAVGSLLSKKPMVPGEWEKLHDSLGSEISFSRILRPSYEDLPSNLKSCFLYFSIFPEDYSIDCGRLIRLWVAERFVEKVGSKTPEEVAEDYLNELIGRNLVHASKWDFDGRAKSCRVLNLVLEFILQKSEEENFVLVLAESRTSCSDKIRRLSIHNACTTLPRVRVLSSVRSALPLFTRWDTLNFIEILGEFKLLGVLDLQGAPLEEFPEAIFDLTLLRYLSLRNTKIKKVPKRIKKLSFLETLDLKQTDVNELPKQVIRLHNLRHLLVGRYNVMSNTITFNSVQGVKLIAGINFQKKKLIAGIGVLTNLQKLSLVKPDKHGEIINQLGALTQLRKLGLTHLKGEDGKNLCTSIEKMQKLRTFDVCSTHEEECLNLGDMRNPPRLLERLYLKGRLQGFPTWISSLDNLFRIGLKWSRLHGSPLEELQKLPNLMELQMADAYTGKKLVFEAGRFKKLKILYIEHLDQLHTVEIEEEAMPELQKLTLHTCLELKMLPLGIKNLTRVEELILYDMPKDFITKLQKTNDNKYREMVDHIPVIHSFTLTENRYWSRQNFS